MVLFFYVRVIFAQESLHKKITYKGSSNFFHVRVILAQESLH